MASLPIDEKNAPATPSIEPPGESVAGGSPPLPDATMPEAVADQAPGAVTGPTDPVADTGDQSGDPGILRYLMPRAGAPASVPAPEPAPLSGTDPGPEARRTMLRLVDRMQTDLAVLTEGKRVATDEEIQQALRRAKRALGLSALASAPSGADITPGSEVADVDDDPEAAVDFGIGDGTQSGPEPDTVWDPDSVADIRAGKLSPEGAPLRDAAFRKDGSPESTAPKPRLVGVSATQWEKNPYDQIDVGPIPGYPETGKNQWRSANDRIFLDAVNDFNRAHGLKPGDPEYVWASTLKAQAMIESGGEGGAAIFLRDPLQVNNSGDWVDEKVKVMGLTGPSQVMTPAVSAAAALKWLYRKGLVTNPVGSPPRWIGMERALRKYNGKSKVYPGQGGVPHKIYYAARILQLSRAAQILRPTWRVCVPDSFI